MGGTTIRELPFGREPSETDLMAWIAAQSTDAAVEAIALADGPHEVDLVRSLIQQTLRDHRIPSGEPEWALGECSALKSNHTWPDMGPDDHLVRLLAASVNLSCLTRLQQPYTQPGTMARLIRSAAFLGPEAVAPTSSFLSWLVTVDDEYVARSFHGLGVLLLEAFLDPASVAESECSALVKIVEEEEVSLAEELKYGEPNAPWLLKLDDEQKNFWEWPRTAAVALAQVDESHPLRRLVARFGEFPIDPWEDDRRRLFGEP